ncbi:LuxR C-terminal-related transcriptional regulator [Streptomyces sp. NPDC060053]|uniref:helix-turn-helix transcriptional regulator n=1 Tax=Streptomyces sp. NPDC060053 TaxID=3347047 RepID=UPI00368F0493
MSRKPSRFTEGACEQAGQQALVLRRRLLAAGYDQPGLACIADLVRKRHRAAPVSPNNSYASCNSAAGPAFARAAAESVTAVSNGWPRERAATRRGVSVPRPRTAQEGLSERDVRLIGMVSDGSTNRQIAARQACSEKTVEQRLTRLFQRTGCHSRVELAAAWLDGSLARRGLAPDAGPRGALVTRASGQVRSARSTASYGRYSCIGIAVGRCRLLAAPPGAGGRTEGWDMRGTPDDVLVAGGGLSEPPG